MGKVAELAYEIQELYIDGMSARGIAITLRCSIEMVLMALESFGVEDNEEASPYATINS
jgi:hypothetical protein